MSISFMWHKLPDLMIKCLKMLIMSYLRFVCVSVLSAFELANTYLGTLMERFCHFKSFTERQMYHSDTRRLPDSLQHKHMEKCFL